jgi:hypothetical protein
VNLFLPQEMLIRVFLGWPRRHAGSRPLSAPCGTLIRDRKPREWNRVGGGHLHRLRHARSKARAG